MPNVSSARPPAALERQVVEAWGRLRPERAAPDRVEVLEGPKDKKTVCRLAGAGPGRSAVIGKRYRLAKGRIEHAIYTEVLSRMPAPALRCYGVVEEADGAYCWLFLEDAGGERFAPFADEHRALAGRWLGLLHTSAARGPAPPGLPDRGPGYYLERLREARQTIDAGRDNPALSADDGQTLDTIRSQCDALEAGWPGIERLCAEMPHTVIHGDFVKKNLRVRPAVGGGDGGSDGGGDGRLDLLVFDWGSAGWGVPAADLAQPLAPSARFSANPDLAAYWAAVREHWPSFTLDTIRRWANVGSVFRSIVSLGWAARSLGFAWVEGHMVKMRVDQAIIARAMRAAAWAD